ncbi:MAG: DUF4369 domain-containing protein, partial [Sphingobacteriales bacterium]|nr:DUF4369 domain-containing protein [Sphingobacteriales bacterium]
MKRILSIICFSLLLFSCKNEKAKGTFSIKGEIKNAPDQKIYIEELFFSERDPEILDTATIKNGQFTLTAIGATEGLYRLRLSDSKAAFVFINDKPEISFSADLKNLSLKTPTFNTPANILLREFIVLVDSQKTAIQSQVAALEELKAQRVSDSIYRIYQDTLNQTAANLKNYIVGYIDTTSDPVMALFALGYTRNIDASLLERPVATLSKRFPKNESIAAVVQQYNKMVAETKAASNIPQVGSMAPELKMPDTTGKMFALSSLRGKY